MKKGLVSIITPCYNGAIYIGKTIESVLSQGYQNWEMIIVDDGSKDDSAVVIRSYAETDDRITYLHQENAGSAAARNNGIRNAEGQYIALLDADDLWDPAFLSTQISFMKEKQAVCVYCSYRRIDEKGQEIGHPTIAKEVIGVKEMTVMNEIGCLTGLYDSEKHGKIYLREELKSLRDDYAYWFDIVRLENRACGNPEVLASYRVMASSTTGSKKKLIKKQYQFYRKYLKLSPVMAAVNTVRWGMAGLKKFSS